MDKVKEQIYENATRNLLKKLDSMNMDKLSRIRAKNMVLLFRDSFKASDVKYKTFYPTLPRADIKRLGYDSTGFCFVSSATFLLLNPDTNFALYFIDNTKWFLGPHFFLKDTKTNAVFDLTYDQFTYNGNNVPYDLGEPELLKWDDLIARFTQAISPKMKVAAQKAYKDYVKKTGTRR